MARGRGSVALALVALLTAGCSGSGGVDPTTPQAPEPLRVLLAGDSITVGYYATDPAASYAALLLDAWGAGREVEVVRAEEAGARAWRIARQVEEVAPSDLDVAVIEVGANDVGTSTVREYAEDVARLVDLVERDSPGVTTVCLGPWNAPAASRRYDRAVERVCDGGDRTYVPISDLYDAAGMRGPVGAATSYGPRDDFHPNDQAHVAIAERVLAALGTPPDVE